VPGYSSNAGFFLMPNTALASAFSGTSSIYRMRANENILIKWNSNWTWQFPDSLPNTLVIYVHIYHSPLFSWHQYRHSYPGLIRNRIKVMRFRCCKEDNEKVPSLWYKTRFMGVFYLTALCMPDISFYVPAREVY